MNLEFKPFATLTIDELHNIFLLRSEVFVVEQACIYQDIDGKDPKALHVLGYVNDHLAAYARVFKPGDYFDNYAIGRVVVRENHRNKGLARKLMKGIITFIEQFPKKQAIELSAQTYLIEFYKALGFVTTGNSYLEDGIPHIKMIRSVKS